MSDSSRRHAVITGGTSGAGFHAALALALDGWDLTLAARVVDAGTAAAGRITGAVPSAHVDVIPLDLTSLASVSAFASRLRSTGRRWDSLLLAASAQLVPFRTLTEDGFEWNLGVNHLAQFALVHALLPHAADDARVVAVTSLAYRSATMKFYDLRWDNGYRPGRAYAMSKLAVLLASRELARRADSGRVAPAVRSIAVHPGLIQEHPAQPGPLNLAERIVGQTSEQASACLVAGVSGDYGNGAFVGPAGPGQLRGEPRELEDPHIPDEARAAERLWLLSCQLTGIQWA